MFSAFKLPYIVFIFLSISVKAQLFFENVATNQNIDYANKDNIEMGAGVSFCDFDGEGWNSLAWSDGSGEQSLLIDAPGS